MIARTRHISSIRVIDLFGYNTFNLSPNPPAGSPDRNLFILYGDNGSGKTTILRLTFCLLASVDGRGYKSEIARTPFREFAIDFNDGTVVSAQRTGDAIVGTFLARISIGGLTIAEDLYRTNDDGNIENPRSVRSFLKALTQLSLALHFLPDNRRLASTVIDDESVLLESRYNYEARHRALARREIGEEKGDGFRREDEAAQIQIAISRLTSWFREKAFIGSNEGTANAYTLHLELLRRIASYAAPTSPDGSSQAITDEVQRLAKLDKISAPYVAYGLTAGFPAKEIISIIQSAPAAQQQIVLTVAKPLVDSFEARVSALSAVEKLISLFIGTMQEFYRTKGVLFSIEHGLQVWSPTGVPVRPEWLSSGERQLLLLFSNTIVTRDRPTIFIIDEPELSLNSKWQRQLLSALSSFAEGSDLQFLLATHSFEVLAQHTDCVAQLKNLSGEAAHGGN